MVKECKFVGTKKYCKIKGKWVITKEDCIAPEKGNKSIEIKRGIKVRKGVC